jgi:hypothetical protein
MLPIPLPAFDATWEAQRQSDSCERLAKTLGPYFARMWITARRDDPLVSFVISDGFICMEFARSRFIEFSLDDCPFLGFQCCNPKHAWQDALAETEANEMAAIAAVLGTADALAGEAGIHMDSGEDAFLGVLGLDREC